MIPTPDYLLAAIAPLTVAAAAWVLKRWITRLDTRLEALASQIGDLKLKAAVSEERFSSLLGAIDTLRQTGQETTKDVGRIVGSIDRLWTILRVKGLVEPRLADRTGSAD